MVKALDFHPANLGSSFSFTHVGQWWHQQGHPAEIAPVRHQISPALRRGTPEPSSKGCMALKITMPAVTRSISHVFFVTTNFIPAHKFLLNLVHNHGDECLTALSDYRTVHFIRNYAYAHHLIMLRQTLRNLT